MLTDVIGTLSLGWSSRFGGGERCIAAGDGASTGKPSNIAAETVDDVLTDGR